MNPSLLMFPLLLVLAVAALIWWRVVRSSKQSRPSEHGCTAERMDTTLGELRDLREALRPLAAPIGRPHTLAPASKRTGNDSHIEGDRN